MKVIYIAGMYRASTEWEVTENIRKAEKAAIFVWQHGGAALCPHKNTAYFGGVPGCSDETWLRGDIEMMLRCDAVYAIPEWSNSRGARVEVTTANSNKMPILFNEQQVIDFLLEEQDDGHKID